MKAPIEVKIIHSCIGSEYPLPTYVTLAISGIHLHAMIKTSLSVAPGETILIPIGISVHIADPSLASVILPLSGLCHKHGRMLSNLVVLINSDCYGPLMVSCWNRVDKPYTIEIDDRMTQLFAQQRSLGLLISLIELKNIRAPSPEDLLTVLAKVSPSSSCIESRKNKWL